MVGPCRATADDPRSLNSRGGGPFGPRVWQQPEKVLRPHPQGLPQLIPCPLGQEKYDHHRRYGRGWAATTWRGVVGISPLPMGRDMTTTWVLVISRAKGEGEIPTTPRQVAAAQSRRSGGGGHSPLAHPYPGTVFQACLHGQVLAPSACSFVRTDGTCTSPVPCIKIEIPRIVPPVGRPLTRPRNVGGGSPPGTVTMRPLRIHLGLKPPTF
jgi:hypothetical protein